MIGVTARGTPSPPTVGALNALAAGALIAALSVQVYAEILQQLSVGAWPLLPLPTPACLPMATTWTGGLPNGSHLCTRATNQVRRKRPWQETPAHSKLMWRWWVQCSADSLDGRRLAGWGGVGWPRACGAEAMACWGLAQVCTALGALLFGYCSHHEREIAAPYKPSFEAPGSLQAGEAPGSWPAQSLLPPPLFPPPPPVPSTARADLSAPLLSSHPSAAVSASFLAWIRSPCLRHCVHGASIGVDIIGGGGGRPGGGGGRG
jgi:hypothetical protein